MTKALGRRGAGGASAMTSFVGRRRELSEAKTRMTESRLVTLTGPGGVGKTRLAFELADRSRKAFRDGVWEIELASLEDESIVASTVLSALPAPDRPALEKLVDYLRDRQLLIVLDNCENLLPAVSAFRTAPSCPRVADSCHEPGAAGNRRRTYLPDSAASHSLTI
jgi:predicted ATPase